MRTSRWAQRSEQNQPDGTATSGFRRWCVGVAGYACACAFMHTHTPCTMHTVDAYAMVVFLLLLQLANVTEAFSKLGDQLNCVDKSSGFTLLHILCKKPSVTKDLVGMLLDIGADCNVPDKWGRTVMHLAATAGHNKCVRRLLAAGANPNLVSDKGLMPLLQTFKLKRRQRFQRGKLKVAEALVRSGRSVVFI